jgi:hypothetical protein
MNNFSWTNFNFNFAFLLFDYCLIKLGVYLFKDYDACFFKLSVPHEATILNMGFFSNMIILFSTIFYVFSYYVVEIKGDTHPTKKFLGYSFSVTFVIGVSLLFISKFIDNMGLYLLIIAALCFLFGIYAAIKISIIDGCAYKARLVKWLGMSSVFIILGVGLDVAAGSTCWNVSLP